MFPCVPALGATRITASFGSGTPGKAWVDAALERAFPGSFATQRSLPDEPDRVNAFCRDLLA